MLFSDTLAYITWNDANKAGSKLARLTMYTVWIASTRFNNSRHTDCKSGAVHSLSLYMRMADINDTRLFLEIIRARWALSVITSRTMISSRVRHGILNGPGCEMQQGEKGRKTRLLLPFAISSYVYYESVTFRRWSPVKEFKR